MASQGENTHFVKRVVLPSGKTIEVVYFRHGAEVEQTPGSQHPPAERHQALHVCLECESALEQAHHLGEVTARSMQTRELCERLAIARVDVEHGIMAACGQRWIGEQMLRQRGGLAQSTLARLEHGLGLGLRAQGRHQGELLAR